MYLLLIIICLFGCQQQFNPWEVDVDNYGVSKNLTEQNIEKLENNWNEKEERDSIVVAVISDSHLWYKELESAVNKINEDKSVDLVLHAGDMTETGSIMEYKWFVEKMSKLNKPWFAVIGNHDCLSDGLAIYNQIFGDENFSFSLSSNSEKRYNFVFFNDNMLEISFSDIENRDLINWLGSANQLGSDQDSNIDVLIAHVPPDCEDYFSEEQMLDFGNNVRNFNYEMFIYGHTHAFHLDEMFNDGVIYFGANAIEDNQFSKIIYYEKTDNTRGLRYSYENITF